MKYYAIRTLAGKPYNKILTDWGECSALIRGKAVEYKSFKTEEQANDYLGSYKQEEEESDVLQSDNHIFYVDGSYMDDTIGWGFVYVLHNEEVDRACGSIKPFEGSSRNITGELTAAMMAVGYALARGFKKIYIVNDYQGISSFLGAWTPKTKESKDYATFMKNAMKQIDINFVKVKGHSSNKFNDIVDEVAKKGTNI